MTKHWKEATPDESAAEARHRIAEAAASGAKLLNLGDLLLAELPAELGSLDGLEALALGDEFVTKSSEFDERLLIRRHLGISDDFVAKTGSEFSVTPIHDGGPQPHDWKREKGLVLPNLAPLCGLTNLRQLSLKCVDVKDISALAELGTLEWLDVRQCSITKIAALASLSRLKYLNLAGDSKLDLSPLSNLSALEQLDLRWRPVKDLSALSRLSNLKELSILAFRQADVSSLKSLPRLTTLRLHYCKLKDLTPFQSGFENLQELDLMGVALANLTGVRGLSSLRMLKLEGPKKLRDLSPLAGLTTLEHLDLTVSKHIRDLSPLADLPNLHTLVLDKTGVKDFAVLQRMKALRSLDLHDLPLRSLEPIAKLRGLQVLNLAGCHKIKDISELASMEELRELDLSELDLDLAPLAKLERLEKLTLRAAHVNALSLLRGLRRLRSLSLWVCKADSGVAELAELSRAVPI